MAENENKAVCYLDSCKKVYNFKEPGEALLGDLNFCSEQCCSIWMALTERECGYSVFTKEQCDEILKDYPIK